MAAERNQEQIHTRIWLEEAEPNNNFSTRTAHCHGYDVYGEMLGHARWVEMLYLLFRGERPTTNEADQLEILAIALANAGPRDPAVHAAMCGAVGGSPAAACLMAALSVGAGQLSGAREVFLAMQAWEQCGSQLDAWRTHLTTPPPETASIWPTPEHPPGFDPHGVTTPMPVMQTLARLMQHAQPTSRVSWLHRQRAELESYARLPLAMTGVAAAAFSDLGCTPAQGEMLHLLLRLPGAAAHALEQTHYGHKKFPFFDIVLESDSSEKTP